MDDNTITETAQNESVDAGLLKKQITSRLLSVARQELGEDFKSFDEVIHTMKKYRENTNHLKQEVETVAQKERTTLASIETKFQAEIDKLNKIIADKNQNEIMLKTENALKSHLTDLHEGFHKYAIGDLKDSIKLNQDGTVMIVDPETGMKRYTDTGTPMTLEQLAKSYVASNTHMHKSLQVKGTGTKITSENYLEMDPIDTNPMKFLDEALKDIPLGDPSKFTDYMKSSGEVLL